MEVKPSQHDPSKVMVTIESAQEQLAIMTTVYPPKSLQDLLTSFRIGKNYWWAREARYPIVAKINQAQARLINERLSERVQDSYQGREALDGTLEPRLEMLSAFATYFATIEN